MQITLSFTTQELRIIARALTFGIIHNSDKVESQKMQQMEKKLNQVGAINAMDIK